MLTWILLILFVILVSIDSTCFYILNKVIINYKEKTKGKNHIPGYNIYKYIQLIKEMKE